MHCSETLQASDTATTCDHIPFDLTSSSNTPATHWFKGGCPSLNPSDPACTASEPAWTLLDRPQLESNQLVWRPAIPAWVQTSTTCSPRSSIRAQTSSLSELSTMSQLALSDLLCESPTDSHGACMLQDETCTPDMYPTCRLQAVAQGENDSCRLLLDAIEQFGCHNPQSRKHPHSQSEPLSYQP